ncbi:MAG: hypothetical protein RLZZ182_1568 [Pseudomonadota bacterium]
MTHPAPSVEAHWFDGRSARAHTVLLQQQGDTLCLRSPQDGRTLTHYPVRSVHWPERTRHGARIAQLPDGGSLQALSPSAWDQWRSQMGQSGSWVEKAQLSWRATLLAMLSVAVLAGVVWQWGLPWAAREVVALAPRQVDQAIGERAWAAMDSQWFTPSKLPPALQASLQNSFQKALRQHRLQPAPGTPLAQWDHASTVRVLFRQSRMGPNALALPDGTLVVTDDLVRLVDQRPDILIGVLGHEWGHVQARHSMRQLLQAGALGLMVSSALGDFSGMVAALPLMMGQMAYSRDFEREADEAAIAVLRSNGISPAVMATLFERLQAHAEAQRKAKPEGASEPSGLDIAFSSHPATAERIARFRSAPAP